MRQLSDLEMDKAEALKDARTLIRRKYARMADRELNTRLPELEKLIDRAIQSGKSLSDKELRRALEGGE